jgi:hypothetical protein
VVHDRASQSQNAQKDHEYLIERSSVKRIKRLWKHSCQQGWAVVILKDCAFVHHA